MKPFRKLLLAALIAASAVGITSALAQDAPAWVPKLQTRANDYAGILGNAAQRKKLEDLMKAVEVRTTAQICALTVAELPKEGTNQVDIRTFSIKVAEAWKCGQAGKDNGIILVYALKEDRFRIEVGYGLEGAIPDGAAGEIIRKEFRRYVTAKSKDYLAGFMAVVEALDKRISAEAGVAPREGRPKPTGVSLPKDISGDALWVLLFLLLLPPGIAGFAHPVIGGVVGAGEGALAGWLFALGLPGVAVLALVGFVLGFAARFILEIAVQTGFSGGGSSSGGLFSGGGGSFGGGGADG